MSVNEKPDLTSSENMMAEIESLTKSAWKQWYGEDDDGPGVSEDELFELIEECVRVALDCAAEYPATEQRRVVRAVAKVGRETKAGMVLRGFSQALTNMETNILWLKP